MAYTIAQIETLLLKRAAKILAELEYDSTTNNGSNPDLLDPIIHACLWFDITITDPTSVADSDISTIESDELIQFLDVAEYRLLINLEQNFDLVDVRIGHRQEEFSQLANRLMQRIDRLRTHLRDSYGYGLAQMEAGVIDLDIDQNEDDDIAETSGL